MGKKDKKEIRFIISKSRYDKLKKEAEELNVPLASLIKIKIGNKNGRR